MKLGVITDGISRDFEHALKVMKEADLEYAEIQFAWDKEIGDFTREELQKIKDLLDKYERKTSCITRHIFAGLSVMDTNVGDADYNKHFDALKRCVETSKELGTNIVRTMSYRKEMILFGQNGAEKWNASDGAWDKFLELMRPVVEYGEQTDTMLVVETGNNAIITSTQLGAKAIKELGTNNLKILWDPANSLYCNEDAYPTGINVLMENDILGHFHLKDAVVDIPNALVRQCQLGNGSLGPHLTNLADELKKHNYDGVVSLESVYHPGNGDFEEGFHASLPLFKEIFG